MVYNGLVLVPLLESTLRKVKKLNRNFFIFTAKSLKRSIFIFLFLGLIASLVEALTVLTSVPFIGILSGNSSAYEFLPSLSTQTSLPIIGKLMQPSRVIYLFIIATLFTGLMRFACQYLFLG